MPHALAATSRPAMTVRAFEIAPEKTARFDARVDPGRGRAGSRARRVPASARARRDTRRAGSADADPNATVAPRANPRPPVQTTDASRPNARSAFFNRRMPATAASGRLLSAPRF